MSEARFTPGSWRQATGVGYCAIRTDAGVIADMRFVDRQYNPFNANLIAAAPELYAALHAMCSHWDSLLNNMDSGEEFNARIAAGAALAKARGE